MGVTAPAAKAPAVPPEKSNDTMLFFPLLSAVKAYMYVCMHAGIKNVCVKVLLISYARIDMYAYFSFLQQAEINTMSFSNLEVRITWKEEQRERNVSGKSCQGS